MSKIIPITDHRRFRPKPKTVREKIETALDTWSSLFGRQRKPLDKKESK